MSDWTPERVKEVVDANKIVVFAKGTKFQPQCGFSNKAIDILNRIGQPFEVVNIFEDENIRPSLVQYSGWPTTPHPSTPGWGVAPVGD